MVPNQDSNPPPVNRKSDALPIVPPRHTLRITTKNIEHYSEGKCGCDTSTPGYAHVYVSDRDGSKYKNNIKSKLSGDVVIVLVWHRTCDSRVAGSSPRWNGHYWVVALDKLLTPVCICHQAV